MLDTQIVPTEHLWIIAASSESTIPVALSDEEKAQNVIRRKMPLKTVLYAVGAPIDDDDSDYTVNDQPMIVT